MLLRWILLAAALPLGAQMTLLSAEGRVYFKPPRASAFQTAVAGAVLPPQSVVRTGEDSRAVLVSRSGQLRRLPPDSRLTIPAEVQQDPSALYTAAINKNQSLERTRLSMTQVAATRAQPNTPPLQNAALTTEQSERLAALSAGLKELDLTTIEAALVRGALLEEFVQWASAENLYMEALAANPGNATLVDTLADLYFKQGKIKEAFELKPSRP